MHPDMEETLYRISELHKKGLKVKGWWFRAFNEIVRHNRRVIVKFHANAWCDEDMMKFWVRQMWKPVCDGPMHLILDVHRAQTTEEIQTIFARECQTTYTFIPGGCTSMAQAVDVSFNRPFKSAVERLASQHMQENLQG